MLNQNHHNSFIELKHVLHNSFKETKYISYNSFFQRVTEQYFIEAIRQNQRRL